MIRALAQGPRFESVHVQTKFFTLPSLPLPKDSVSPAEAKKDRPQPGIEPGTSHKEFFTLSVKG
jgi:hypothetical protein